MKLHWSPRSPFVRKVMVCAHETGLAGRIELVRSVVAQSQPNVELMRVNPLSRIPALVTDDGQVHPPIFHCLNLHHLPCAVSGVGFRQCSQRLLTALDQAYAKHPIGRQHALHHRLIEFFEDVQPERHPREQNRVQWKDRQFIHSS